jgi:hypothetical protein
MKQRELTPELIAQIQAAVGQDVDTTGFAVFEAIALNSMPLPGKRGALFEKARVSLLTLRLMADNINGGNHLPLMRDHRMDGNPLGRVFRSDLSMTPEGEAELRVLFFLDATETVTIAKLNAGVTDEVSVSFLAEKLLCSECGFDFRGSDASWSNVYERTCAEGHRIGEDGVHIRLVGLEDFTETSLVSRGAADKPKVVGKSQAKLAAASLALVARGFEVDELYLTASKGEVEVDLTAILARVEEKTTEVANLKTQLSAETTRADGLQTTLTAAEARVTELEAAAAENTDAATLSAAQAEVTEARTVLADIYTRLATASGETDVKAPDTIADLKAGIETHQSKLTAILPVGGAAASTQSNEAKTGSKFNASSASAFVVNR